MKKKKLFSNLKLSDWIGLSCGILIIIIGVALALYNNAGRTVGTADKSIPDSALTLTGKAAGRNGDVSVEVVADASRIYRVTVTEHAETQDIGTKAVEQIPATMFKAQSVNVDAVSGATISSNAIKEAVISALTAGGFDPAAYGEAKAPAADTAEPEIPTKTQKIAAKVVTGTGIMPLSPTDWAKEYPEIYTSYIKNQENKDTTDYVEDYPMISVVYEGMAFNTYYDSARGHIYTVNDITATGRPHKLANCFTCKTPDFTAMVNNNGVSAYSMAFEDAAAQINNSIGCYNCHANDPNTITVTHTYLTDAMGEDFESIDAANLSCGQCHVEYYFAPDTKATTLPYSDLESMSPDAILEFYNNFGENGFTDYTNPRTGVKQIKVQHPEFETYLGEGSIHKDYFTCADCHMGEATAEDGTKYPNHYLTSPLENEELISGTCSNCHADLVSEVKALQSEVEARTYSIGYELEFLTEKLAAAVEAGEMSEEQLNEIRAVARDAQFYWDFVFVENSEGAHNPELTKQCLDKAESLTNKALGMFK